MAILKKWLKPILILLVVLAVVLGLIWLDRALRNEPHPRAIMSGTVTEIAEGESGKLLLTVDVITDYSYTLVIDEDTTCYGDLDRKKKISAEDIQVGNHIEGRYRWLERSRVKWISIT